MFFSFGSKVLGSRTGMIFNCEMDDFSTPGKTNVFGVPSSPQNYIVPGKRPMSSMSPLIAVDDAGRVRANLGAAGGTRIITAIAQVWEGNEQQIKEKQPVSLTTYLFISPTRRHVTPTTSTGRLAYLHTFIHVELCACV